MEYSWAKDAQEWVEYAPDTTIYCERCLILEALLLLEIGRTEDAKAKLIAVFHGPSGLVRVPNLDEIGISVSP